MIIIRLFGGLGNQLFQYALYTKLKKNREVYIDTSAFVNNLEGRKFGLDDLNLGFEKAGMADVFRLSHHGNGLIEKVGNHIPRPRTYINEDSLGEYQFHKELLDLRDAYLEGYWQCADYFNDVKDDIMENVRFRVPKRPALDSIVDKIRNEEAVSIHMRFGDFLEFSNLYGGICTKKYYYDAMDYISSKHPDATFYLFSDDRERGMKLLKDVGAKAQVVEVNKGADSYLDMYLMTLCKHNIIANSSFSFWGAYLNWSEKKIVVCPDRWINADYTPKIAIDNWIEMRG